MLSAAVWCNGFWISLRFVLPCSIVDLPSLNLEDCTLLSMGDTLSPLFENAARTFSLPVISRRG